MVTPRYYPAKGGTEVMVRNLAIGLNRIGIPTDIMTFNMDEKWKARWQGCIDKIDGITIYKIPGLNWLPIEHSFRNTQGINLIPAMFAHITKLYDVLHFHELELSFPAFSMFIKKPKIFHLHGIDYRVLQKNILGKLVFKHSADIYIAITKQMMMDLVKLGIPLNKIKYLPNGVDLNLFHPIKDKEKNLILFVGRITYGKGVHILLKALEYLKTPVHLVIIGPIENHEYFMKILKIIKKVNSKNRHKIIYQGSLDQTKIIEWYQKASILVLPSFWEAFPVVILEALSCETSVIATSVGGIPEIIKQGKTGILVKPGDYVQLANAIQFLLDNTDVREKIASKGREHVISQYSLEVVSMKLYNIYAQLLKKT
jgi:glycosyltransferase involved in cell wall biosynthesis